MSKEDNQLAATLYEGLSADELFMSRCVSLANLGAGYVAPNPMVGAVLVHEGRIIGEGYHRQYGHAHAEVNCIDSVRAEDLTLISRSKLYVSLEPCSHHGKTPPCADLIIRHKIPEVVIGCRDPFPAVNGKGIEKLKEAGISIRLGILETACRDLNKRFFLFQSAKRPYIVLKWAQSADGFIARSDHSRTFISNEFTNRLVHQWRSEEAAILVGTNTALHDDPELTARHGGGHHPLRLVFDGKLRLPNTLRLFDQKTGTIVFNQIRDEEKTNLRYYRIDSSDHFLDEILAALHHLKIQSVLVEGGAQTIRAFIEKGFWDEARIITNEQFFLGEGISAPRLPTANIVWERKIASDQIVVMKRSM